MQEDLPSPAVPRDCWKSPGLSLVPRALFGAVPSLSTDGWTDGPVAVPRCPSAAFCPQGVTNPAGMQRQRLPGTPSNGILRIQFEPPRAESIPSTCSASRLRTCGMLWGSGRGTARAGERRGGQRRPQETSAVSPGPLLGGNLGMELGCLQKNGDSFLEQQRLGLPTEPPRNGIRCFLAECSCQLWEPWPRCTSWRSHRSESQQEASWA